MNIKKYIFSSKKEVDLTGLLAYFRFDDDLMDEEGTHNGVGANNITYSVDTIVGTKSVFFDKSIFSRFNLPDHDELTPFNGSINTPFSWSVWIKPTNMGASNYLFMKRANSPNRYEYHHLLAAGTLTSKLYDQNDTPNFIQHSELSAAVLNTWSMLTITYNGLSGTNFRLKIYKDGVFIGEAVDDSTFVQFDNTTAPLWIGSDRGSENGFGYDGYMGALSLWEVELSPYRINSIYNKQFYGAHLK